MWVERVDGQFKNGATSSWTIVVTTVSGEEPITLRPLFFDATELASFVDQTFPGACFSLLPPTSIAEAMPQHEATEGVRAISGQDMAEIIRTIGEGMGQGDAYEPFSGQRGGGGRHHGKPTIG